MMNANLGYLLNQYIIYLFELLDVRKRNLKRIILGHLNINSVRNKFDLLVEQIKGKVDIMVISETKG